MGRVPKNPRLVLRMYAWTVSRALAHGPHGLGYAHTGLVAEAPCMHPCLQGPDADVGAGGEMKVEEADA